MRRVRITAVSLAMVVIAGALAATSWAGHAAVGHRTPGVNQAHFNNPKPNPYFPLNPGTVLLYRGSEDRERFKERLTVTDRNKTIQRVRTTVVLDVLRRADGTLAEKTHDWYADDNDGNVWYFGEDTATYDERGHLESREGSWEAGVHGAVPGLIMPADPKPTDAYRQEFYSGHAEDQAWIVQRHAGMTVPYRKFHDVVRSFEWTRLEPHVVSVKFYGRGVGIIREQDVAGGTEIFRLVSVSRS